MLAARTPSVTEEAVFHIQTRVDPALCGNEAGDRATRTLRPEMTVNVAVG